MKDFLQGKWLGHPLHPALVHVPMGLWPGAFILDLFSRTGEGDNVLVQTSFYAILLGLVIGIAATLPGWADWSIIKREKPAWKLGLYHLALNGAGILVWAANLAVRVPHFQEASRAQPLELWLSAGGTLLLLVGAWFGKRMVFDQGTSVARLSKGELRKRAENGGSALPEK